MFCFLYSRFGVFNNRIAASPDSILAVVHYVRPAYNNPISSQLVLLPDMKTSKGAPHYSNDVPTYLFSDSFLFSSSTCKRAASPLAKVGAPPGIREASRPPRISAFVAPSLRARLICWAARFTSPLYDKIAMAISSLYFAGSALPSASASS